MDEKVNGFANCILNKKTMQGGIYEDTFRTMQLIFNMFLEYRGAKIV
jgi:hypothetical protein